MAPTIPPITIFVESGTMLFPITNSAIRPKNKNPWIIPASVTAIGWSYMYLRGIATKNSTSVEMPSMIPAQIRTSKNVRLNFIRCIV